MTERTTTVDVGRRSLSLREWGDADAPVVLCS
jgi:hypothetical protein